MRMRYSVPRTGGATEASIRHFGTPEEKAQLSLQLSSTYTYVDPANYSLGCKFAMLLVRGGELAGTIVAAMRAMWIPEPTDADRRLMAEHGRLVFEKGDWQITPMGLHAAQVIMLRARTYGIHYVSYISASRTAKGHAVRCTCGYSRHSTSGNNGRANVMRMGENHLQDWQDGTLPPAYVIPQHGPNYMDRICNELVASLAADRRPQ